MTLPCMEVITELGGPGICSVTLAPQGVGKVSAFLNIVAATRSERRTPLFPTPTAFDQSQKSTTSSRESFVFLCANQVANSTSILKAPSYKWYTGSPRNKGSQIIPSDSRSHAGEVWGRGRIRGNYVPSLERNVCSCQGR